jgi:hypothetical protein
MTTYAKNVNGAWRMAKGGFYCGPLSDGAGQTSNATEAQLLGAGWKPYIDTIPSYNTLTQTITDDGLEDTGEAVERQFTVSYLPDAQLKKRVHDQADEYLRRSDWSRTDDNELTSEQRSNWATWRASVRAIRAQNDIETLKATTFSAPPGSLNPK